MILVDSSIWIDHFRTGDMHLYALLKAEKIIIHTFVVGELSLGHMPRYDDIMTMLTDLPTIPIADDAEVRHMIRSNKLFGKGIGYVDAHLLASLLLSPRHTLWTRDKRLHGMASAFGVAMPSHLH
jgi:predicted nucleic acid-binding protein